MVTQFPCFVAIQPQKKEGKYHIFLLYILIPLYSFT